MSAILLGPARITTLLEASSLRRQQVDIIAVAGTVDAEIAAVEAGDSGDTQALGDRHETAVYNVEFRAGIDRDDVLDSARIAPKQRHKFYLAIPQVFQERTQCHITEVAHQQVSQLSECDIGQQHPFRCCLECERCCRPMVDVFGIVERKEVAGVCDERHRRIRRSM